MITSQDETSVPETETEYFHPETEPETQPETAPEENIDESGKDTDEV